VKKTLSLVSLVTAALLCGIPSVGWASVREEVYVTGTILPFGGYRFSGGLRFDAGEPGPTDLGTILVDGMYNGEYPWRMRCYTDNLHFAGVAGSIHTASPAGLVSTDGRFVVPLLIHSPVFGEDSWRAVPDINDAKTVPYKPALTPGGSETTECIVLGIDPRNANWVAGPDNLLFTRDDIPLGDFIWETPFELSLRADFDAGSVQGTYDTYLYFETVPAP